MTKTKNIHVTLDGINYESLKTLQEIKTLTDNDLLEYLCSSKNDEEAYNEFVNRYIKDCGAICEKLCKRRRLDSHIGVQILSDTFEKVRRYKSYKRLETTNLDERKAILAFLYRIALNLFNDHYNQTKKSNEPYSTYFDDFVITTVEPANSLSQKEFAAQILKSLNKNEQTVMLTDFEYKKHYKYLPDWVIEKLSTELSVKPDTIRKIRERAIVKVKTAIDKYNEQ